MTKSTYSPAGKPQRTYTEEEIEEGLVALAFTRSARRAAQLVNIPSSTLDNWVSLHADRLEKIRADLSERLAQEHDTMVARLASQQHEILDVLAQKSGELKAAEAAGAVRNLAVSQAIHEDKALLHRGKPTQRVEHTADEVLRKLNATGLISVDSTAEEIKDAQVVDDSPSSPAQQLATGAQVDDNRADEQASS